MIGVVVIMAKIFIDSGHGGNDPGAVGKRSKEKDNVLKVAKKLKSLLESYGHSVKMSRSTDKFISLSERARMANSWGADYFVSLHNNAATASAAGFETFIYNGSVSQKTKQFQSAVHGAIAKNIGIRDRGKKSANFAVLRQTKMPAVLIEYAFISNATEEKILIDKVDKLAEWTCDGIIDAVGGTIKAKPSKPKKTTSKPKKTPKTNGAIAQIQNALNKEYGFKLAVDNIYGRDTKKHLIKAYQTELNKQFNARLAVDGIWGKKTRAATVNVRSGARGKLTWLLQAMLVVKGHNIDVDGIFGSGTNSALKSFQQSNKLTADGIAGKATWSKLFA